METTNSLRAVQIVVLLLLILVAIGGHAIESRVAASAPAAGSPR